MRSPSNVINASVHFSRFGTNNIPMAVWRKRIVTFHAHLNPESSLICLGFVGV